MEGILAQAEVELIIIIITVVAMGMEVRQQVPEVVIETEVMLVEGVRGKQKPTEPSIIGSIPEEGGEEGLIRAQWYEDLE